MSKQLPAIQLLRGLAAVAVVYHHAIVYLRAALGTEDPGWNLSLGARGVELFFVLSGFIIFYVHFDDTGAQAARSYIRKRLVRIFPVTFIVASGWAAFVVLSNMAGLSDWPMTWKTWISSAFIVPVLERPDPLVIWTLRHELLFYAIFMAYFFSHRLFAGMMAVWFLASLAIQAPNPVNAVGLEALVATIGSGNNILFAFGLVAGALVVKGHRAAATPAVFLVSLVLLSAGAFLLSLHDAGMWEVPIFGLLSALAVYAATGVKWSSGLELLGDASFSIYLVHVPLMVLLIRFIIPLSGGMHGVATVLTIASGIVGGVVFYRLIEKPTLDYFRSRTGKSKGGALSHVRP